jgi:hypothetical protein
MQSLTLQKMINLKTQFHLLNLREEGDLPQREGLGVDHQLVGDPEEGHLQELAEAHPLEPEEGHPQVEDPVVVPHLEPQSQLSNQQKTLLFLKRN